jgi:hypothetical protein
MTHEPKIGDIWQASAGKDRDGFSLYSANFEVSVIVLAVINSTVVKVQVIKAEGDRFRVNEKIVVDLAGALRHEFPLWNRVSTVD